MQNKPKLVLCVDRDNDLYEKAGISGPIIGREANLNAAVALGIADPSDADANAIFKAISVYDKLSKTHSVQIATLTGSSKLGYAADEAISEQLDRLLAQFPCESCIFVSDGESDSQLMPIIQSRIKIDSVEVVVMKQAKELEKTYFVILEKLKEPYYARLIFGIPALVLLLFVISYSVGWSWHVPVGIISLYLLLKAFGIEDAAWRAISSFDFSTERISLVVYLVAIPLIAVSFWSGYQTFVTYSSVSENPAKVVAASIRSILVLLPWPILLLIGGRVLDMVAEKRKIEIVKYGQYAVSTILFWIVFWAGSAWVANDTPPYVSFEDFMVVIIGSVLMGFASITLLRSIKRNALLGLKLENKEVLGAAGNYMGKVIGIDPHDGLLIIKTALGQKTTIHLEDIERVGEKILLSG
jgi:putative membrane protein